MKHLLYILAFVPSLACANGSVCHGTTSDGSLENGVQLPPDGKNFVEYSEIGRIAGRTYVHSEVRDIVVAAYKALETEEPNKVYKYAETGLKEGGKIWPHKSHRNGLSVDFMTPVITKDGKSEVLPTNVFNKFGYNIEFDSNGRYEDYKIDYDAMAAHIVALHKAAKLNGHDIWRVIFDPKLQPGLYKTKYDSYIKQNITLSKKPSWVRHDEHYHVDFIVSCKK